MTWREHARCRGAESDIFFELSRKREALAICKKCPVREPCFIAGTDPQVQEGIWGGTTEAERRNARRQKGFINGGEIRIIWE